MTVNISTQKMIILKKFNPPKILDKKNYLFKFRANFSKVLQLQKSFDGIEWQNIDTWGDLGNYEISSLYMAEVYLTRLRKANINIYYRIVDRMGRRIEEQGLAHYIK